MRNAILILVLLVALGAAWWYAAPTVAELLREPNENGVSAMPIDIVPPTTGPDHPTPEAQPIPSPPEPAQESVEERVSSILNKRYPTQEFPAFDELLASWGKIPETAFPDRVRLAERQVIRNIEGANLLGISVIAAGGEAKPVRLEGSQLTVASLADESMQTEVSVSQTDFNSRIEERYQEFCQAAQDRLNAMRSRAAAMLPKLNDRERRLADGAWHDSNDPAFEKLKANIITGASGAAALEEAKHFFDNGYVRHEAAELEGASYSTYTVYFEVNTIFGFVPYEALAVRTNRGKWVWLDPIPQSLAKLREPMQ